MDLSGTYKIGAVMTRIRCGGRSPRWRRIANARAAASSGMKAGASPAPPGSARSGVTQQFRL